MKTKIEVDVVEIVPRNKNWVLVKATCGEKLWKLEFLGGNIYLTDVSTGDNYYPDFFEINRECIVASAFLWDSHESFEFRFSNPVSLQRIREIFKGFDGEEIRLPDSREYLPNPERLKYLVSRTGLTKAEISSKLGISERALSFNLMDPISKNYRKMPYTTQFAIECLVPGMKKFMSVNLLVL